MKPLLSLLALTLSASMPIAYSSIDLSPDVFFRAPEKIAVESVSDHFYPKGARFPFSFYSVGGGPRAKDGDGTRDLAEAELQALLKELQEAGVTAIGPQYSLNERAPKDAAAHGMGVIYSIGLSKKAFRGMDPKALPLEEIRKEIREEIVAASTHSNIIAWDLRPEELRPWRAHELAYLQAASQVAREADPQRRPLYHYCPGHYTSEAMAQIAPFVDYLGKGMYTNYSSQKESRIWCKWTIDQEIAAIEASGSKAIPIALPEMFRQPSEEDLGKIPAWVRHDLYLSLVSGAKGVLVFSMRQRENFPAWRTYLDAYLGVARELFRTHQLGRVFLFGEKRSELQVEVISGPKEVELTIPSANINEPIRYPSIHWLDVAYGADRYLIAVNSSSETCRAIISGFPYDAVTTHTLFEERPTFDIAEGEYEVEFAPLEVKAYRYTRK